MGVAQLAGQAASWPVVRYSALYTYAEAAVMGTQKAAVTDGCIARRELVVWVYPTNARL